MQSKQQKRLDAEKRNSEWAKLTPNQQIDSLMNRPGCSEKQIAKIKARAKADIKGTNK